MPNLLYVSFNDSRNDPTYSGAESCSLVESNRKHDNPCVEDKESEPNAVVRSVPLIPTDAKDIQEWARMLGWMVKQENGFFVIETNIEVSE